MIPPRFDERMIARAIIVVELIVLLIVGAIAVSARSERDEARAEARGLAARQVIAARATVTRTDTVFRRDTVTMRQAIVTYRTTRDTLTLTDTVQVKVALERADTAIEACTDAVSSCSLALAARDTLAAALTRENAAIRATLPSRTDRILGAGKWALLGAAGGILLSRF